MKEMFCVFSLGFNLELNKDVGQGGGELPHEPFHASQTHVPKTGGMAGAGMGLQMSLQPPSLLPRGQNA